MSSSTAKTPESNTECSQDSRSPGLQHTPLQAELTASLLFKQPSTPNTHTRLLPAMLLLAMLLAAQMPAMVKSRSIPSSAHLIVDQGREGKRSDMSGECAALFKKLVWSCWNCRFLSTASCVVLEMILVLTITYFEPATESCMQKITLNNN